MPGIITRTITPLGLGKAVSTSCINIECQVATSRDLISILVLGNPLSV